VTFNASMDLTFIERCCRDIAGFLLCQILSDFLFTDLGVL
jgi:hypothetical protein